VWNIFCFHGLNGIFRSSSFILRAIGAEEDFPSLALLQEQAEIFLTCNEDFIVFAIYCKMKYIKAL
jgi:hypothetical protein